MSILLDKYEQEETYRWLNNESNERLELFIESKEREGYVCEIKDGINQTITFRKISHPRIVCHLCGDCQIDVFGVCCNYCGGCR